MGQKYLQRFVYSEGVTKPALDDAWGEAFKAFARSGNWGDVDSGVVHHQTYGTGWGGYALIAMGPNFSSQMFARFGRRPQGPFGPPRLIYTAPIPSDSFVYGAVAHPEHTEGGQLLISYSINSWQPGGVCAHVEYYRPRFIRVPLAALDDVLSDG